MRAEIGLESGELAAGDCHVGREAGHHARHALEIEAAGGTGGHVVVEGGEMTVTVGVGAGGGDV